MAIVKQDYKLESAEFIFDRSGDVKDVVLQVNYQLYDDVANVEETRRRVTKSIWSDLSATQKTQANTIGKRLKTLGEAF